MSEYTGVSPSGRKCSYTMMGQQYNNSMAPVQPTQVSGVQIVPSFGPVATYDVLTDAEGSCSGYRKMSSAYGGTGNQCNVTYTTKSCGM